LKRNAIRYYRIDDKKTNKQQHTLFDVLSILNQSMKKYLKRQYDKPLSTVFYSSLDTLKHFPSRVNFRQHIIQPSTKEQQRLLSSSSSSPRFHHVHSGKYGIRPIWPSEESSCEQWKHGKKSNKVISIIETINTCKKI